MLILLTLLGELVKIRSRVLPCLCVELVISWTKFLEHAKSQSICEKGCEALSVCQLTSGTLKSPRIKVSVVSGIEFK